MIHLGHEPGFLPESLDELLIFNQFCGKDIDGVLLLDMDVLGMPYVSHAPSVDPTEEAVVPENCSGSHRHERAGGRRRPFPYGAPLLNLYLFQSIF